MRSSGIILRCAVLAALAACEHGDTFTTPFTGSDAPHQAGNPARLTYAAGNDGDAAWLPDGSGFLYTGDRVDRGDARCLMQLPATGGRAVLTICPAAADSFNELTNATLSAAGRLGMVVVRRIRGQPFPNFEAIAVAPADAPLAVYALRSVPFTSGGLTYNHVSQLRWVSGDTLVFRGGFIGNVCEVNTPCSPGTLIFLDTGLGLFTLPADSSGAAPVLIPGTAQASSVAASADGDAIYYTLTNDSHVYRRIMSTGVVTSVADFPSAIVRDVQVAGSRLVVVVGGAVRAFVADGVGLVQQDQGGDLAMVDMATGGATFLTQSQLLRHPALSPDGKHIVAEQAGELWLYDVP